MSVTELLNPALIDFPFADKVKDRAESRAPFLYPIIALFRHAAHATVRHKATVHYISDNGNYADTARGEIVVRQNDARAFFEAISGRPGPRIEYHDIPSQDTHAAAFDLAQYTRGAIRGFGNIFFVNCAPRKKQRGQQDKNAGETVYIGIMPNGAIIAGTGEDAFVHFKDLVVAGQMNIYRAHVATDKSQFRSRDYFPWLGVVLGNYINRVRVNGRWKKSLNLEQREQLLFGLGIVDQAVKLAAADIPDLPHNEILAPRADTHANLKLAIRHEDVAGRFGHAPNPDVVVIANDRILSAKIATSSFEKPAGTTVISCGSSGHWQDVSNQTLEGFAEIFTVGDRARDKLGIDDRDLKNGVAVHIIPSGLFDAARIQLSAGGIQVEDAQIGAALVKAKLAQGIDFENLKRCVERNSIYDALQNFLPPCDRPIQDVYRRSGTEPGFANG